MLPSYSLSSYYGWALADGIRVAPLIGDHYFKMTLLVTIFVSSHLMLPLYGAFLLVTAEC
jgi:hypothetical protein